MGAPFCVDCRWAKVLRSPFGSNTAECRHPAVQRRDPVWGLQPTDCDVARRSLACGESGRKFEARVSWWLRLIRAT
jgi:hypothetical protein